MKLSLRKKVATFSLLAVMVFVFTGAGAFAHGTPDEEATRSLDYYASNCCDHQSLTPNNIWDFETVAIFDSVEEFVNAVRCPSTSFNIGDIVTIRMGTVVREGETLSDRDFEEMIEDMRTIMTMQQQVTDTWGVFRAPIVVPDVILDLGGITVFTPMNGYSREIFDIQQFNGAAYSFEIGDMITIIDETVTFDSLWELEAAFNLAPQIRPFNMHQLCPGRRG